MRTINNFDLTKTEIKKVERAANKIGGRIIDWHTDGIVDCDGYTNVLFRICCEGQEGGTNTIALQACVSDCRKSYVVSSPRQYTLTPSDIKICRECLDSYLPGVVSADAKFEIDYPKSRCTGVICTDSINGNPIQLGYSINARKRSESHVRYISSSKGYYGLDADSMEVYGSSIRDILDDNDAILYDRALLERKQIIMVLEHFASTWIDSDAVIGAYDYVDGKYIFTLVDECVEMGIDLSIDNTLRLDTLEIINRGSSSIPAEEMIKTGCVPVKRAEWLAHQYMADIGVPHDYCCIECKTERCVDILICKGLEYRATVSIHFNPHTLLTDISMTGLLVSNTLIEDHGLKSWAWKSVDNSWSEVIECKKSILRIIYGAVIVNASYLNKQAYPRLLLRNIGYTIVKCSSHMGYVRLGADYFADYSGRYGEGFAEHSASESSTRYHTITYWIKNN